MSFLEYLGGLPPVAPQVCWTGPVELGLGLRCDYPIMTAIQQYALFEEVYQDWVGPESQLWESVRGVDRAGDVASYNGPVSSIQLSAKPGYYMTPDQLMAAGYDDDYWNP